MPETIRKQTLTHFHGESNSCNKPPLFAILKLFFGKSKANRDIFVLMLEQFVARLALSEVEFTVAGLRCIVLIDNGKRFRAFLVFPQQRRFLIEVRAQQANASTENRGRHFHIRPIDNVDGGLHYFFFVLFILS